MMADPRPMTHLVPRGGWRLPFDVVAGIMAASPPSTVSALMKSCHALYVEGPKHILRDGVTLNLDRHHQIAPFANFMLAEGSPRFAHLRKLNLFFGRFYVRDFSALSCLADLLAHPSLALEVLVLRNTEAFLGRFTLPPLHKAICRLTTIKHLVLPGMGIRSANILQTLQSNLESLSIGVAINDSLVSTALRVNIVQTLRPFSNSLQTLLIRLPSNSAHSYLIKDAGSISFPHVKTFGIVYNPSVPDLLTDPMFAQAFPAITNLKIIPSECPTTLRTFSRPTDRKFERIFTAKRDQILQRQASTPPGSLLRSLLECSGELLSVYPLAFDHTLSTLRLWKSIATGVLPILRTVLEDTRPQHLCLSAHVDDVEQVYGTLRGSQIRRIDLNISLFNRVRPRRVVGHAFQKEVKLRSLLESFVRPLPTGLIELNLTFDTPFTPGAGAESIISDALAEFTRWASTAAPSLILTYTLTVDKGWEWPDLGQRQSGMPDDDVDSDDDYPSPWEDSY